MTKRVLPILLLSAISVLAGCSSAEHKQSTSNASQAEAKKPAETEYLTGREAFQKLYVSARSFAPDVKPYRLESTYTEGAPAQEGKAALWRAEFASPSRRSIKAYSWSGVSGPDAPERGVSHGTEDTYNPSNTSTQVFDIAFLKIDSGKAFEEAQKHGGEKLTKQNPKQPVFYVLDWNSKNNQLTWHVVYGSNRNDAKLTVAIDATTGAFRRVEH